MECVGSSGRPGRGVTGPSDLSGLAAREQLDRLANALAARDGTLAGRDPPFREAAVAVVLVPRNDSLNVLLMRRAIHETDPWSGQVSLPGGRLEPDDKSLLDTAIRETREETGLDLNGARVLGALDELRPRTPSLPPIIVRPYVVTLARSPALTPSAEVAELFWAPVEVLFDRVHACRREVRARGHQLTVDAIDFEGRVIWGMTERILRSLESVWVATK